jgi:acyl-CoA reductase-like NAD-dependent aldehyde dehydrogenase
VQQYVPGNRHKQKAQFERVDALRDIAAIGLAGGVETSRSVIRAAADQLKPQLPELGGKNALVVQRDCFGAGGRGWDRTRPAVRPSERMSIDRFTRRSGSSGGGGLQPFRYGRLFDPLVTMGPRVSRRQLTKVWGWVDCGVAEGAMLRTGGPRLAKELPPQGVFHAPVVLDEARYSMRVAREEIIGPVVRIIAMEQ